MRDRSGTGRFAVSPACTSPVTIRIFPQSCRIWDVTPGKGHGIEHPGHSAGITLEVGATVEGTAALAMQRSNVARVYGGYDIACVLRCFHRKLRYQGMQASRTLRTLPVCGKTMGIFERNVFPVLFHIIGGIGLFV